MKNIKLASFVLVLVIVSMSCSLFTPASSKDGAVAGDINQDFDNLPIFDPEAPLPSPGAMALRALAELDPSVAVLESDVEAAEQAALNALVADLQAQLDAGGDIEVPFLPSQPGSAKIAIPAPAISFPTNYNLMGNFDGPIDTSGAAAASGGMISLLSDKLTQYIPTTPTGTDWGGELTMPEGSATSDVRIDIGRNSEGSTKFGLGFKTEASKNGVSVKSEWAGNVEGQRCPNAEGQVSYTIKTSLGADVGGAGFKQDLTAFVRAVVGDDAKIVSTTIDVTQATRQVKEDGRQLYVESGETYQFNGENYSDSIQSNLHLIRKSQDVSLSEARDMTSSGQTAAFSMAYTSLITAERAWLTGGCTQIVATSPGAVQPGSTTSIPVTVRHKFDGSEVSSKIDAVLSGDELVEPSSLAKTPGTLKYIAPEENGKAATITLTATSKRGKSTLELKASTGGAAYQIVGGLDEFQTSTAVCDIMGPFTLTGGGFSMRFSGGLSGSYTYSGPFGASGSGSYAISLPNGIGQPGSMTGGGSGCVETPLGTFCDGGTETYSLSPLPEGSCP